jgi:tetratricopeptide (TPR) repeat protein
VTENSKARLVVFISSTVRDLHEHRKEVMDACLRMDMLPKMMEHLPASDSDAIRESLRMVDEAGIYLGIFAYRYGYVPAGHDRSLVEMEYQRAVELGIPRLIFLMHKDHPVLPADVETGQPADKLEAFKRRLETDKVVNYFRSPEDLRAEVISSLTPYREPKPPGPDLSAIPKPPEPYVAHLYTLRQTPDLVGREKELGWLTEWVAGRDAEISRARILSLVGLSGTGKSALAWKWFNDIAPQEMRPLAGRVWWSFHESDATFENFVTRALTYVTGRKREDIENDTSPAEREELLLAALNREPFLVVLDGLERLFNIRAGGPRPEEEGAEPTAPAPPGGDRYLRKTADPRVDNFLRKLSRTASSRIVISTRRPPADLQTVTGDPLPGSHVFSLGGLSDHDALRLWAEFKVTGSPEALLDFFHTFGNLPLLIQTLAGVVAGYRRAPGDFDAWRRDNPELTPFDDPTLGEVTAAIVSIRLHGSEGPARRLLYTIAAFYMPVSFYMPVTYSTLVELLVEKQGGRKGKLFANEAALDDALVELEGRGLLGWDWRTNRYELHPIIRSTVWNGLAVHVKQEIYEELRAYFQTISYEKHPSKVERLEDLTAEIEFYNALINLGLYEKAGRVFLAFLDKQLAYGLGDHRRRAELLRLFFVDGLDELPRHKRKGGQAFILSDLATAYFLCGQPRLAVRLYQKELQLLQEMEVRTPGSKPIGIIICLRKMGIALGQTGNLRSAEHSFRTTLLEARAIDERFHEAVCWQWLGILLATRSEMAKARAILEGAGRILSEIKRFQSLGLVYTFLAQCELWRGEPDAAQLLIERAHQLARIKKYGRDLARVKRLQGAVALAQSSRFEAAGDFEGAGARLRQAEENFNDALLKARTATHVREELQSFIGLAELERRRQSYDAARPPRRRGGTGRPRPRHPLPSGRL